MLTVIAEIRTRPGQHHRQAVSISLRKSFQPFLKKRGATATRRWWIMPRA
ncbi:quinol monooxygenase [Salmonella enterica subsp. arizonae]|uniref:Quinol monooxygenase n=1 Tax=Salmonella enterica subsp. arizonae TaxID=59203 RepID=A0A2X4T172_SALER|nr:quinol monooxygenase [Salmonella enterica subsp. arizonae]